MSVFRSYFSDDNTIINKSEINTGRNEITELVYGNVKFNSLNISTGNTIFSRFLFRIDFDNLMDRMNKGLITQTNIHSHKIHLKNTINLDKTLTGQNLYDNSRRSFDITLKLYKIYQNWVEGVGHDFIYNNTLISNIKDNSLKPSNWFDARMDEPWDFEGAISGNTDISGNTTYIQPIGEQYFKFGNEDLEIDVTDDINDFLFNTGTTDHFGYVLAYDFDVEAKDDEYLNKIHFFSRQTNTFFEPFLETEFDNVIDNSRNTFIIGEDNKLFINSKTEPTYMEICDDCDEVVFTSTGITNVINNTYCVEVNLDNVLDLRMFTDKWFTASGGTLVAEDQFTTYTHEYFENNISNLYGDNNLFNFSIKNIGEKEKMLSNEIRQVFVEVKTFYKDITPKTFYYRIYTLETGDSQIEVIPRTQLSKSNNEYFFLLDTSWLIPKDYILEISFDVDDFQISSNKILNFTIVSNKTYNG